MLRINLLEIYRLSILRRKAICTIKNLKEKGKQSFIPLKLIGEYKYGQGKFCIK